MLEKVIEINNIGCFRRYAAKDDVSFRKLTLFYAENGRGKTTLCAILRSLQSGQKELIAERKTLGVTVPPFVHIRLNEDDYRFTDDAWTITHPDIAIFDPVFINENVYSGDFVEHEHKKNLYRVIVGAHGVELATQIENLDRQIRDANSDLRFKKGIVESNLPSGVTLEAYLQWQPVDDIDDQIQNKLDELSKRQQAIARINDIQSKGTLGELHLPSIPPDVTSILGKKLNDIASDVETMVREQIDRHQMGRLGESWLSQGLNYVKNDCCPFCGQEVHSNDLIAAYKNLKQEVAQLSQSINNGIGETAVFAVQQRIADNLTLAEFWKQFLSVELPDVSFHDIQVRYAKLREHSLVLAKRKQDNPAEPVVVDAEYSSLLANVEALREVVDAYNAAVEACSTRITEQKTTVQSYGDLSSIQNEIKLLQARKFRFEPEISNSCRDYQEAVTAKAKLEHTKETIRQQLDQYCASIIQSFERSINDYLDQFNAGFRITNTRHLYTGGTPSSHYQIEINNTAVDLGDTQTEPGTPCFKTTLSSGDRGALALAFFLAVLKSDPNISSKIIVFDDPFTSLDRFRRTCTQQLIQGFLGIAQQVIVLSHDPRFLTLLWDGCSSASTIAKTLQMAKTGDTTIIGKWDIDAETQSTYMKDYSTLLDFSRERKGDTLAVARTIRPFLESMLRSHFPGYFQKGEWLGDFIAKIRAAPINSGLQHAKADLDELDAINNYSKKYHHDQNFNADSEPINEDELEGYVKRALKLVGGT